MSLLGRVSGGMFGMCWFGCNGCMLLQGCLYWDVLVVGCLGCVGLDVMVVLQGCLTGMFGMCWFGCNGCMPLLGRVSGGMFGMCWFGCNGCMHLQGCLYWDVLVVGCLGCVGLDVMVVCFTGTYRDVFTGTC